MPLLPTAGNGWAGAHRISAKNLFSLCASSVPALHQFNTYKKPKHVKNAQQRAEAGGSRDIPWSGWAPGMVEQGLPWQEDSNQPHNPIPLGRGFCNTFVYLFFLQEGAKGWHSGESSRLKEPPLSDVLWSGPARNRNEMLPLLRNICLLPLPSVV